MRGGCQRCGGSATIPPLCLWCMHHNLEVQIDLVKRSLAEGSPWFGANLLTLLRRRKAELPTTKEQRIEFWLSGGRGPLERPKLEQGA
jgi:hypothetical protein